MNLEHDKSIIDHLADKGDPHAIVEQRRRNILYRQASLGDEASIQKLQALGWTKTDLLANQVLEFNQMGLHEQAKDAWEKLKGLLKK